MRLDNIIRYKLLELSKKYDVSLIEIQKPVKKGRKKFISKVINFNYKPKDESPIENKCKTFYNKRDLVSWLICQNLD